MIEPGSETDILSELDKLNLSVPVAELVTPESKDMLVKASFESWVSILKDSPLKKRESEMLLGKMIATSLNAGKWVDIEKQGYLQPLIEKGFVTEVNSVDGTPMLRPTEALANFAKTRLLPWAPAPTAAA